MPKLVTVLAAVLVGFAGVAIAHDVAGEHGREEEDAHHHLAEANGVRALHAWTRATDEKTALVFVTIENASGAEIRLEGAESGVAARAELVGFRLKDGEPDFARLPFVPVKPGHVLILQPRGLAIRLSDLDHPLAKGEEIELEFHFDSGHLPMHVQVEATDAAQHSHAGHQH
ncbi:copper chaperone PCu(A)C [Jiella endophytica]|uniref:Copper chaperone PCu(A)C n=1 Tax=Jiella endophytica TaxID=2558362 RepID=A0A4Y8RGA7_9HYPH|nr:copper chaperone PCu(A)C [Jiella endophytica]TFF20587.1 copper chaperone PCu(A)C [Jiella endophytica]